MTDTPRRRRRQRHPAGAGPSPADLAVTTMPVQDPPEAVPVEDRDPERGLRGLVGGGSSQVSVTAALRARDAARATPAELARAESELVIVRRGWVPPESR